MKLSPLARQKIFAKLKMIEELKERRVKAIYEILRQLRRAQLALDQNTSHLSAIIREFNQGAKEGARIKHKIQWDYRPPLGGPLGPGGIKLFSYKRTAAKLTATRKTFFRKKELEQTFSESKVDQKKILYSQSKKITKRRLYFVSGLNRNIQNLSTLMGRDFENKYANKGEIGRKTQINLMVNNIEGVSNHQDILLRQLLEEVVEIDNKLEKLMIKINGLYPARNGAIRLIWRSLGVKHNTSRICGPVGPYWVRQYHQPNGEYKVYEIVKLTDKVIQGTYSGKYKKVYKQVDRELSHIRKRRKALNNQILSYYRMTKSRLFNVFIEENHYE